MTEVTSFLNYPQGNDTDKFTTYTISPYHICAVFV